MIDFRVSKEAVRILLRPLLALIFAFAGPGFERVCAASATPARTFVAAVFMGEWPECSDQFRPMTNERRAFRHLGFVSD